jgi:hypothetical protein
VKRGGSDSKRGRRAARGQPGATGRGMRCGRRRLCRPAAAVPQRWKLATAVSSVASTAPRVRAACATSRTREESWTSTVHLLFGSPATCVRPVALRPRLATGLPLSIGRRPGRALTDGNRLRRRRDRAREAKMGDARPVRPADPATGPAHGARGPRLDTAPSRAGTMPTG